jgi:hypothetical protein
MHALGLGFAPTADLPKHGGDAAMAHPWLVAQRSDAQGVSVWTVILRGPPAAGAIEPVAGQETCDLILPCRHGRSGLGEGGPDVRPEHRLTGVYA